MLNVFWCGFGKRQELNSNCIGFLPFYLVLHTPLLQRLNVSILTLTPFSSSTLRFSLSVLLLSYHFSISLYLSSFLWVCFFCISIHKRLIFKLLFGQNQLVIVLGIYLSIWFCPIRVLISNALVFLVLYQPLLF